MLIQRSFKQGATGFAKDEKWSLPSHRQRKHTLTFKVRLTLPNQHWIQTSEAGKNGSYALIFNQYPEFHQLVLRLTTNHRCHPLTNYKYIMLCVVSFLLFPAFHLISVPLNYSLLLDWLRLELTHHIFEKLEWKPPRPVRVDICLFLQPAYHTPVTHRQIDSGGGRRHVTWY